MHQFSRNLLVMATGLLAGWAGGRRPTFGQDRSMTRIKTTRTGTIMRSFLTLTAVILLISSPSQADPIDITSNIQSPGLESDSGWDSLESTDGDPVSGHMTISGTTYGGGDAHEGTRVAAYFGNQDDGERFCLALESRDDGDGAELFQTISVGALNAEHTLSFWGKRGGGSGTVELTAYVTSDGGSLGDLATETQSYSSTTWVEKLVSFTPTTSTVEIRFKETTGDSNARDPALDDLSLTYIPEPASLALLGLGGLAMLPRRRR